MVIRSVGEVGGTRWWCAGAVIPCTTILSNPAMSVVNAPLATSSSRMLRTNSPSLLSSSCSAPPPLAPPPSPPPPPPAAVPEPPAAAAAGAAGAGRTGRFRRLADLEACKGVRERGKNWGWIRYHQLRQCNCNDWGQSERLADLGAFNRDVCAILMCFACEHSPGLIVLVLDETPYLKQQRLQSVEAEDAPLLLAGVQQLPQRLAQVGGGVGEQPPRDPGVGGAQDLKTRGGRRSTRHTAHGTGRENPLHNNPFKTKPCRC